MTKTRLVSVSISAAVLGLTLVAQSKPAHAFTTLNNPFGNASVQVRVGKILGNMWVAWQPTAGGSCSFHFIGDGSGLNDSYDVVGGSADDGMQVHSFTAGFCGFTVEPLVYNGRSLDLKGQGGNDVLMQPGSGDTWVFGGDGNDLVLSSAFFGRIAGENGNDNVFGGSSSFDNLLIGGDGDDCMSVAGAAATTFDCGPGNDKKVSAPASAVSCEQTVTSC